MADTKNYHYATGRRKSAVARVRLIAGGKGALTINGQPVEPNAIINSPLVSAGQSDQFDISAVVSGGGIQSRVEAIRLAVARALVELDAAYKQGLRKEGFLTRDARVKERKKPGLKRARRAPQWAKR